MGASANCWHRRGKLKLERQLEPTVILRTHCPELKTPVDPVDY